MSQSHQQNEEYITPMIDADSFFRTRSLAVQQLKTECNLLDQMYSQIDSLNQLLSQSKLDLADKFKTLSLAQAQLIIEQESNRSVRSQLEACKETAQLVFQSDQLKQSILLQQQQVSELRDQLQKCQNQLNASKETQEQKQVDFDIVYKKYQNHINNLTNLFDQVKSAVKENENTVSNYKSSVKSLREYEIEIRDAKNSQNAISLQTVINEFQNQNTSQEITKAREQDSELRDIFVRFMCEKIAVKRETVQNIKLVKQLLEFNEFVLISIENNSKKRRIIQDIRDRTDQFMSESMSGLQNIDRMKQSENGDEQEKKELERDEVNMMFMRQTQVYAQIMLIINSMISIDNNQINLIINQFEVGQDVNFQLTCISQYQMLFSFMQKYQAQLKPLFEICKSQNPDDIDGKVKADQMSEVTAEQCKSMLKNQLINLKLNNLCNLISSNTTIDIISKCENIKDINTLLKTIELDNADKIQQEMIETSEKITQLQQKFSQLNEQVTSIFIEIKVQNEKINHYMRMIHEIEKELKPEQKQTNNDSKSENKQIDQQYHIKFENEQQIILKFSEIQQQETQNRMKIICRKFNKLENQEQKEFTVTLGIQAFGQIIRMMK